MRPPLIVTVKMDKVSFAYFDALRKTHFPRDRNFINAHLTLFHALPNNDYVIEQIQKLSSHHEVFEVTVLEPKYIGRGVVYPIDSKTLRSLHQQFQSMFKPWLTNQDKQNLWPHITVQNKVSAEEAKELKEDLKESFTHRTIDALGLQVWEYHGGPWQFINAFHFKH